MATAKSSGPGGGKSVEQLNGFLRGEIDAVETYKIALDNLESDTHARANLETCLQSHQQRVALLRVAIAKLGGVAVHGSGAWDKLVKVVDGMADDIGDKAAVAALEEGELQELDDYVQHVTELDKDARQLVEMQLLPRQRQTQYAISELRKTLH
jgi:hypothetical protein